MTEIEPVRSSEDHPSTSSADASFRSRLPVLLGASGLLTLGIALSPGATPFSPVSTLLACASFFCLGLVVASREKRASQVSPLSSVSFPGLVEQLDRIATALEKTPSPVAVIDEHTLDLSRARFAISEGDWDQVEHLLAAHREHPHHSTLAEELLQAKSMAAVRLQEELTAARQANDPDRTLQLYDDLLRVLDSESTKELQQDLIRWFLKLIMRRMRTGTVKADVAELAGKVSDRFSMTVEGASLRASLPTLRRSAGLCGRCGQPYRGLGDACPQCLTGSIAPTAPVEPDLDPAETIADDL